MNQDKYVNDDPMHTRVMSCMETSETHVTCGKKEIKVTSMRKRLQGDRYNCHKGKNFIPFRYAENIGTTCCTLKLYFLPLDTTLLSIIVLNSILVWTQDLKLGQI